MLARLQGIGAALLVLAALAPGVAQARDPITPLSDIHAGLHCTALTVVRGTEIASFDVDVIDVVDDANDDGTGPRILVRVSGPAVDATGIAEGFSGSPVNCPDAQGRVGNAGAISETIGQYGESVGLVTPIELMLGLRVHPPSSVRLVPKLLRSARPLASPLTVSGLAPPLAHLLERAAAKHGRTVVAAPVGPLGTFAPQPLVPGASVSVMLASGALDASAIGTVTYRDGATVYAFGHPLEGAGRRALPLGDAYVFAVIGNPIDTEGLTSYKFAAPGHVLGTLSNDALDGIVGTVGAPPPTIPVAVTVRDRDRHRTTRQLTNVADETAVGNPDGRSALSLVAPLAVAQAVMTGYDGSPAQETGGLCLHVQLREARAPLRFCQRYVLPTGDDSGMPPLASAMLADVSHTVGVIDGARFAALHVTGVQADVTIARGLRLGTILAARGPRTVRPGHTARVALRVRVYRGRLETVRFRVHVPADAPSGTRSLRFVGTPPGASGGDGGLFGLFGGGGGGGSRAAQSLAQVVAGIAGIGTYDGVTARIAGDSWPVYRDPRLRLDGSATLLVHVAGHNRAAKRSPGSPPVSLEQLLGL